MFLYKVAVLQQYCFDFFKNEQKKEKYQELRSFFLNPTGITILNVFQCTKKQFSDLTYTTKDNCKFFRFQSMIKIDDKNNQNAKAEGTVFHLKKQGQKRSKPLPFVR